MDATQLVLGRGEIYFEEWLAGTKSGDGERYIGNTPAMQMEKRVEFAESRKSTNGIATKAFKTPIREDNLVSFTTDNIDLANLSAWFGSESSSRSDAATAQLTETVILQAGKFYQMGKHLIPTTGVQNLFALGVRVDGVFVRGLFVDAPNGRIGVPIGRVDLNGQTATVTYEIRQSNIKLVSGNSRPRRGSLRFIAKNPHGKNSNYYFPHVLLSSRDQLQLKGDQWQSLTFEADVLSAPVIYEGGTYGTSIGEQAILDEGMSLSEFLMSEDILNTLTNTTIPSRGY